MRGGSRRFLRSGRPSIAIRGELCALLRVFSEVSMGLTPSNGETRHVFESTLSILFAEALADVEAGRKHTCRTTEHCQEMGGCPRCFQGVMRGDLGILSVDVFTESGVVRVTTVGHDGKPCVVSFGTCHSISTASTMEGIMESRHSQFCWRRGSNRRSTSGWSSMTRLKSSTLNSSKFFRSVPFRLRRPSATQCRVRSEVRGLASAEPYSRIDAWRSMNSSRCCPGSCPTSRARSRRLRCSRLSCSSLCRMELSTLRICTSNLLQLNRASTLRGWHQETQHPPQSRAVGLVRALCGDMPIFPRVGTIGTK